MLTSRRRFDVIMTLILCRVPLSWNQNNILTALSPLAAPGIIKMTNSGTTNDVNFVKMTFLFDCMVTVYQTPNSSQYTSCHCVTLATYLPGSSRHSAVVPQSMIDNMDTMLAHFRTFTHYIWWRHQPVTNGFTSQKSVTRSFEVFLDLRLNKRLNKRPRLRWFDDSLWRHCNVSKWDWPGWVWNVGV